MPVEVAHHVGRCPHVALVTAVRSHRVAGCHELHDILQDQETEQRGEVQLAEEGREDASVDLEVGLRDLQRSKGVEWGA